MIVSVTTVRMPSAAIAGSSAASTRVEHEDVGDPGVLAGDAERARLVAERREHPVRRALERLAADDPGDGDDRHAARPGRLEPGLDPGHGEDRPDRDERVRRRDDDRLGGLERRVDLRRRRGVLDAREADVADVGLLVAADEVVLELEPAVVGQDLGPDRPRRSSAGSRAATPRARWRSRATSVGRSPRRSRAVRTMCVARSRSPSRNHVSSP